MQPSDAPPHSPTDTPTMLPHSYPSLLPSSIRPLPTPCTGRSSPYLNFPIRAFFYISASKSIQRKRDKRSFGVPKRFMRCLGTCRHESASHLGIERRALMASVKEPRHSRRPLPLGFGTRHSPPFLVTLCPFLNRLRLFNLPLRPLWHEIFTPIPGHPLPFPPLPPLL